MIASELLSEIKQRDNFYQAMQSGNVKMWFSLYDESNLFDYQQYKVNCIDLPYGHYTTLSKSISGWMYYWQHFGGRCSSAAAFISIIPGSSNKPEMKLEFNKNLYISNENEGISFMLNDQALEFFNHGLLIGLKTVLSHPLANVTIRIHKFILDKADYHPKGFMNMGQYLAEKLIIESYKHGDIPEI